MQQLAKNLVLQLNKALDDLEVPTQIRERANILSKMLHIPKQQAWSLLEGHIIPDADLLQKITAEFEIDTESLSKKNDASE